jgi:hypothetical protein
VVVFFGALHRTAYTSGHADADDVKPPSVKSNKKEWNSG